MAPTRELAIQVRNVLFMLYDYNWYWSEQQCLSVNFSIFCSKSMIEMYKHLISWILIIYALFKVKQCVITLLDITNV